MRSLLEEAAGVMTSKTFWILALGLWICMITAWTQLDGLPRTVVFAGILLVWLGLSVERWRNYRKANR